MFRTPVAILVAILLALTAVPLVLAQDAAPATAAPAQGFSQQDLVGGGSVFMEQTLALILAIVLVAAFSLQLAREYFLRTLDKFTLRLGADITLRRRRVRSARSCVSLGSRSS
jgi:hypothetical protein